MDCNTVRHAEVLDGAGAAGLSLQGELKTMAPLFIIQLSLVPLQDLF